MVHQYNTGTPPSQGWTQANKQERRLDAGKQAGGGRRIRPCVKGFHIYCLRPKLLRVPRGAWRCPDCDVKHNKRPSRAAAPKKSMALDGGDTEAGGVLRTSTRPTFIRQPEPAHLYKHSP